ncbi:MAG: MmgE/PrpD family protein [Bacillota bacterium]
MTAWATKTMVDYTVGTVFDQYPTAVIEKAKIHILDSIGCALGGSRSAIGNSILPPFKKMGGAGESTIIGGALKVPAIHAAFVNGTNANALDFDDTYLSDGIGHPGSSIIPAALAVGEWKKASGENIINAIITAYDVGNRIGLAIQPTRERLKNVWGVGTWQTFCAAIAAAKILNLSTEQMFNAFGVAGATAPLPCTQKWGWDISERPIHWVKEPTGWPCWTGTLAAILAENGFIGNHYILDGENGFWIMAGSDRCDYNKMIQGLGNESLISTEMSIKPYSCCRWQHPALDGLKKIIKDNNLSDNDIRDVVINSFYWVKTQEVFDPQKVVDTQFSIPYTAAMIIMGNKPGPGWYTEENLHDPAIEDLAGKVRVNLDPELDSNYVNNGELTARVEVFTNKGDFYSEYIDIPSGDPRNPLSYAEIEEKFKNQASYVLNQNTIEQVISMVNNLENMNSISGLMELLAGE